MNKVQAARLSHLAAMKHRPVANYAASLIIEAIKALTKEELEIVNQKVLEEMKEALANNQHEQWGWETAEQLEGHIIMVEAEWF